MNKKILFFTFAFVALIATNKQSLAQDTASSAAPLGVEEILVTARKRSESIQDVPVAVTALSVEQVERGNIQRVQDLEKLAPNVEMYDMACLLYTSDAADEEDSVDLGGRRIIKKKNKKKKKKKTKKKKKKINTIVEACTSQQDAH